MNNNHLLKTLPLFVIVFAVFATVSCIGDRSPEEMQEAISRSSVFKRIDKLCTEMSKPNDFRFIQKKFAGNSDLAALRFDYRSDKKHKEIEEFYTNWAAENGWKMLNENRYVKGNQTVVIEFGYYGNSVIDMNVYISCKESL